MVYNDIGKYVPGLTAYRFRYNFYRKGTLPLSFRLLQRHCLLNTNKSLMQKVFLTSFQSPNPSVGFFRSLYILKRHICLPFHKLQLVTSEIPTLLYTNRTSFAYKTSRLVRISLLINALNKRVLLFSEESYFIKAIENFFPVFAYPDINTRGVGRILDSYANPRLRLGFS